MDFFVSQRGHTSAVNMRLLHRFSSDLRMMLRAKTLPCAMVAIMCQSLTLALPSQIPLPYGRVRACRRPLGAFWTALTPGSRRRARDSLPFIRL